MGMFRLKNFYLLQRKFLLTMSYMLRPTRAIIGLYIKYKSSTFIFLYKPYEGPSGGKLCSLLLTEYLQPIDIFLF